MIMTFFLIKSDIITFFCDKGKNVSIYTFFFLHVTTVVNTHNDTKLSQI